MRCISIDNTIFRQNFSFTGLALIVILQLSLWGCARKPWREPIIGDLRQDTLAAVKALRKQQAACADCIDSNINLRYDGPLTDRAISGYLLLQLPKTAKFIVSNPLGQPIFAFASNGESFAFINTIDKAYVDGQLSAFARTKSLPPTLFTDIKGAWLVAHFPKSGEIEAVQYDADNRGIWITIASSASKSAQRQRLLLDPQQQILRRLVYDSNGELVFALHYDDYMQTTGNDCPLPTTISMSGGEITGKVIIELADPQVSGNCTDAAFQLPRLPGYDYRSLQ